MKHPLIFPCASQNAYAPASPLKSKERKQHKKIWEQSISSNDDATLLFFFFFSPSQ